jgi:asparagine synthase (glutamine-hydrolysing)
VCGIYGYVGEDRSLGAPPALSLAVAALWHRGPDDRGTFHESAGPLTVGFAHTRLKIIDLSSGGHQPMSTADGRYTIVYNGEVYNHVQIREDLLALGEQFHSTCDTEVVLKAYARWGKGALDRFRGMFAFAIWDARSRALFVARDRLGVKPLYYIERGRGIAFASEVRALLATGAAPRSLSPRALASYFAFGAVSGGDAIAVGSRSLPPGHTLELKGGRVTLSRYWQLPSGRAEKSSFNEEIEGLRPILRDAVRMRLIADVPVGIFLSGGIDSSVLVALATKAEDAPVHTFTVTFDEESYSEAPYAAEVARLFGCTHQQVHLPAARAAQEIDDAVRALDQPAEDGINTYFVSKAARAAGLAVALSGLGGDELFAGYSSFRAFRQAIAVARTAEHLPGPLLRGLTSVAGLGFAPNRARKLIALLSTAGRPDQVYAILRAMFTPEQCRELLSPAHGAISAQESVTIPDGLLEGLADQSIDPINAYSVLDLSNYLVDTLLRDSDVMSMAHALEVRVPLIDHVLVERALRISGALKLGDGENKPLLTAAVPGLPRSAISRRKMGFTLPFNAWFRGALRPWMEETLLGEPVKRLGFIKPRAVERLWRSFLRGERFISHSRVWCIATLARWCQNNGISA